VQRQFPNTFTEVYLNNLVHLVEADNKGASSAATLLPDLQELDEVYTKEDFDKVEDKLKLVSFKSFLAKLKWENKNTIPLYCNCNFTKPIFREVARNWALNLVNE